MAEVQKIEELLQSGLELFRGKRFREAAPIFKHALMLEPRHTGAAYMLSVAQYFSGEFEEAQHLFQQLTAPGSPLEPQRMAGLSELASYARYEIQREDYWRSLKLDNPKKIVKRLRQQGWEETSLQAWHLYLANNCAETWLKQHSLPGAAIDIRVTSRANQILTLADGRDADDSLGRHLEAIQNGSYALIPFGRIRTLEISQVKRWMTAQVEYTDGKRETLIVPQTYRGSMTQEARGVQEGVETIHAPLGDTDNLRKAYGQKQLCGRSGQIGWSEVARLEITLRK